MPIPEPKKGQKQNEYISNCMKFLDDEKSDMPKKQRLAVCFDKWNKAKRKSAGNRKRHKNNAKIKKSKDLVKEIEKLKEFYNSKYNMS